VKSNKNKEDEELKSIVVIADTHVGNINSICTPGASRRIVHHRKRTLQRKLYEAWVWCRSQLTKPEIDLLVINGDAIDGDNRKDLGSEVWTTSMIEQIDDAVKLFTEYKFKNVIVTTGSGYHVKRGADPYEEILAERLARYETDGELGRYLRHDILPSRFETVKGNTRVENTSYRYTDYKWRFKALNEVFSITHHVGHSQIEFYRSSPLAREMVTSELDASKYSLDERPTILIRSHTHYYCMLDFSGSTGIITAAWKYPDEYLHRKGIGGTLPSIGIIEILLRPNQERQVRKILAKGIRYPKEPLPDVTPYLWKK
jgi:hypothetical protein